MLGLDIETCLLVVAEIIPNSKEPLQYGLILDSNKINLDILKPLQDKGYMYFPDTGKQWIPKWIQTQWGWFDEARTDSLPQFQQPKQDAIPPKKSCKRKLVVGTLEDAPEPEEKGKKAKETEPLTIERCINMTSFDIEKLNPAQMAEMKKLYQDTFDPLYIFGAGPLTGDNNNPMQVHFSYLHKAPAGKIVYRGIQEDRLNAIINQTRIQSKFNCSERVIVVLPLKLRPYGGQGQVSMYKDEPIKKKTS
jgi:hypothetical protein